MAEPITVAVAGSTGSIGTQTIEVVRTDPERYRVVALAAGSDVATVVEQARQLQPEIVAFGDEEAAKQATRRLDSSVTVMAGHDGLSAVAEHADVTINGVVGFAGLPVTLSCLNAGKRLGLANKESLIAAGPVVQQARRTPGAELVPVDSEHAAIHMCLRATDNRNQVHRIQLTASGGPFRGKTQEELAKVTVEQALAHPTWAMGPKITVDSSTLMNKGLEVIEAYELYGTPAGDLGYQVSLDDIDVVVHPQSIVHSMVTFVDGATIAQLSLPDMRLPIGYALAYPDRLTTGFGTVDWTATQRLDFEPPDRVAFPCLELAFEAARIGGTAPAWVSAANEVAVDAFLKNAIKWADIYRVIFAALSAHDGTTAETLEDVLAADAAARRCAQAALQEIE